MSNKVTLTRWMAMRRGGTTGNQAAPVITIVASNGSGGSVARGDIVVVQKTSAFTADLLSFTTTTTADNIDVLGMVYDTSIASGAQGNIQIWGPTDALKVNGTTAISIGDYISTHTVAKIGAKANPGEGTFAIALEAYSTADSSGVIDAFLTRMDFVRSTGKTIASGATLQFNAAQGAYANLINDVNGNELLDTKAVASALNQFGISNGATTVGPTLEARGETNVDINLLAKGTGAVILDNGTDPVVLKLLGAQAGYNNLVTDVNANEILDLQGVASALNEFGITNAITGVGPTLSARGETNVDINLLAKGTGAIILDNGTDPVLLKLMGAQAGYNTSITDVNANELLDLQGVASAVNQLALSNAVTASAPILTARGGDAQIGIDIVAKGGAAKGWILHKVGPVAYPMAATTAGDTATLTVAQMRSQLIKGTPTAAATYTTPTAAQLVADIQDPEVGTSYPLVISNESAGANTITLAGGANVTIKGTTTVAQNIARKFIVNFTNVTGASETAIIYSV